MENVAIPDFGQRQEPNMHDRNWHGEDPCQPIPVVCIGMSSGAVPTVKALFRQLSPKTGMAFVVVHHVHNVPTRLPEILSRCTDMPAELASDGLPVRPNHVYILPSGKEMRLADGFFSLLP